MDVSSASRPRRGRPRNISRDDMLEVAARLFSENGYDRTSLDMIADRLGVTKAGLYYHISSKEEIVLLGCKTAADRLQSALSKVDFAALDAAEGLRRFLKLYLDLALSDFGRFLILVDPRVLSDEAKEEYRQYIRMPQKLVRSLVTRGIEAGTFRQIDPDLAASAVFGMFNWVTQWRKPPDPAQAPAIFDGFMTILLGGLRA